MKKKGEFAKVKLAELKANMFVRKELNQDHVLYLAELIANGIGLPPIMITPDNTIIDGRHRKEAYELNDIREIEAKIVDVEDETELIFQAYEANLNDGPLKATPQDIEHTVMMLLERGVSKKRIVERLGLPTAMARRYVNEVQSRMLRAKLQRAAEAIVEDDLTVAKAAELYGVDTEKLKEFISDRRKKKQSIVANVKRSFTNTYKGLGVKKSKAFRRLFEMFEDTDITRENVLEIFDHVEHLQSQSARLVADLKNRFIAMSNKTTESK